MVLYASQKSLGLSVSIGLDFVFVWVGEIDLISVMGSKLTWFLCGGIEIDVVLV